MFREANLTIWTKTIAGVSQASYFLRTIMINQLFFPSWCVEHESNASLKLVLLPLHGLHLLISCEELLSWLQKINTLLVISLVVKTSIFRVKRYLGKNMYKKLNNMRDLKCDDTRRKSKLFSFEWLYPSPLNFGSKKLWFQKNCGPKINWV